MSKKKRQKKMKVKVLSNTFYNGSFVKKGTILSVDKEFYHKIIKEKDNQYIAI